MCVCAYRARCSVRVHARESVRHPHVHTYIQACRQTDVHTGRQTCVHAYTDMMQLEAVDTTDVTYWLCHCALELACTRVVSRICDVLGIVWIWCTGTYCCREQYFNAGTLQLADCRCQCRRVSEMRLVCFALLRCGMVCVFTALCTCASVACLCGYGPLVAPRRRRLLHLLRT